MVTADSDLQNNMTDTTDSIVQHLVGISWHGHFANVFQHAKKFLNGIADHSPPLDSNYEEMTGQPPVTVSRQVCDNYTSWPLQSVT